MVVLGKDLVVTGRGGKRRKRERGGRVRRILLYGREREGDEREDFDDGRVDRRPSECRMGWYTGAF